MIFETVPFADDEPAPRLAWIREHLVSLERVPLPGHGRTVERFQALAELGAVDGSLARLAEGHLDAVAILDELGHPAPGQVVRGVWAARPDQLLARPVDGRWHLSGRKPWCSGATGIDRALMTATAGERDVLLFDVDIAGVRFEDDWRPIGMRASDSRTACVDVVVDGPLGPPGCYTERPGFWHGGIGVAACWHGLARRITADLGAWAADRDGGLPAVTSGRATALLASAAATLGAAGRLIDDRPHDRPAARRRAFTVRTAIEATAREIVELSTRVQGAGALCFEPAHARAVADVTVYLGQFHHASDPAELTDVSDHEWWTA